MTQISTLRLTLLRAMYLLIAIGLGVTIWPSILFPPDFVSLPDGCGSGADRNSLAIRQEALCERASRTLERSARYRAAQIRRIAVYAFLPSSQRSLVNRHSTNHPARYPYAFSNGLMFLWPIADSGRRRTARCGYLQLFCLSE